MWCTTKLWRPDQGCLSHACLQVALRYFAMVRYFEPVQPSWQCLCMTQGLSAYSSPLPLLQVPLRMV